MLLVYLLSLKWILVILQCTQTITYQMLQSIDEWTAIGCFKQYDEISSPLV